MNDILTGRLINFMSLSSTRCWGGAFSHLDLIAIPSTRVCGVVGLVVECFLAN